METIPDVVVRCLTYSDHSDARLLKMLAFDDHLLSRFGVAEFVSTTGDSLSVPAENKADQVWIVLQGAADLILVDHRSYSPSQDVNETHLVESPALIMIPFGVAAQFIPTTEELSCVRISTEEDVRSPAWSQKRTR